MIRLRNKTSMYVCKVTPTPLVTSVCRKSQTVTVRSEKVVDWLENSQAFRKDVTFSINFIEKQQGQAGALCYPQTGLNGQW